MNQQGKIQIQGIQKTSGDPSFRVDDAVLIRFTNSGQNHIWIDEQEILKPGESFVEGDVNGPGLDHVYNITFITNAAPPASNIPLVYPGNFLNIRLFKRV